VLTEQEKYELVWDKVARYGKVWTNPGLGQSIKRWVGAEIPKGAMVMDFGCGNGTSLDWLKSAGYAPTGVDIARNATKHPDCIVGDLRDDLYLPLTDYGICIDVMEHIPTTDVGKVLAQIARTVRRSVLFVIARDRDKDGAVVGQELHLTRRPKEFWDAEILAHFASVDVLRYNPDDESSYCLWAGKC
jgi:2-polyprenyl-3-methyl-5-hydroxy-6-metoxy-1,4-benzoquinol methylase